MSARHSKANRIARIELFSKSCARNPRSFGPRQVAIHLDVRRSYLPPYGLISIGVVDSTDAYHSIDTTVFS
jgi:hypothetical protein